MKLSLRLIVAVFATGLYAPVFSQASSRTDIVAVTGWIDDTRFGALSLDANGNATYWSVDVRSGKAAPATEEKSPQEIISQALPSGIFLDDDDVISPDSRSAIIIKDNDLWSFSTGNKALKQLTNDAAREINTRYSPDATKIAYTKNRDLYVYDLANDKEIRLTADATDKIYNGYASWVYFEEILGRPSKYAAFWWSNDGTKIAYLRFDDADVPLFTLNRLDEPDGVHGLIEAAPYPKAGDPNPKVKMGVADIATAKTTWIDIDYSADQYIAWPFWSADSKKLAVQIMNRDQSDLKIILADPNTGSFTPIYSESRETWVEFFEDVYVMNNGSGFILRSAKSDWENLYYYAWDGKLISRLTDFDFRVTSIDRVDEAQKVVYFSATGEISTDLHCFRVGLDGKNLLQMTKGEGTHIVDISPKGTYYIDEWSSVYSPGAIVAYDKNGKLLREIHRFEQPPANGSEYARKELVRINTSDGLFNMPAVITYPLNFDSSKRYPVVFQIYGGPDARRVYNRWEGSAPSWYAENGIITISVDHRGSGHFGKQGLDYMYRCLGKWEILDYQDAVKWLREKPFVDPARMGITGSSYGGYITCLALTKGSDFWTHGVSTSPVTDFRLYDNVYTERFMDTPQDNPDGYKNGSSLTYINSFKGKLLLNHGDMDDNVHMQNSIYFISRMQDAGKTFEFMLYPGGRHGWGGAKALHLRNSTYSFWTKHFFGE